MLAHSNSLSCLLCYPQYTEADHSLPGPQYMLPSTLDKRGVTLGTTEPRMWEIGKGPIITQCVPVCYRICFCAICLVGRRWLGASKQLPRLIIAAAAAATACAAHTLLAAR